MTEETAAGLLLTRPVLTRDEPTSAGDPPRVATEGAATTWSDDAEFDPICTAEFSCHSKLLDTRLRA
jgi:hypothetical protein